MSSGLRRYWAWLLGGAALGIALAVVLVGLYTRTTWGRGQILGVTVSALGGQLNGVLTVDRLDGNVLTGARLYGVSLADREGVPLVVADSAFLEYEIPTFLGGDVVINRLVLYDPELLLVRLPGDSLWNYQHVLQDTSQTTGGGAGRATLVETLELVSAEVTVRLPWEPDEAQSPAARRAERRAALSDTSRLAVDSVDGGLLRTMRFDVAAARLSELYVAPDERGGTYLRVDSASGEAYLYREPALRFRQVQGEVSLREGVLRYTAPAIVLPDSRLASTGVVDVTGEEPAYDLVVTTEGFALADLAWLLPAVPEEGDGEGTLWLETRPEGLLVQARDFRVSTPGTRIRGDFGMVLGDTLRFVDVELTAAPLDVPTVERMLPAGLPVEGLRIGAVEIRSDAS